MYICKSENASTIAQMELPDFFSETRKIIFDMDDERDSRKALRVLKPKGMIKKKRIRKLPTKPQRQKTINEVYILQKTKTSGVIDIKKKKEKLTEPLQNQDVGLITEVCRTEKSEAIKITEEIIGSPKRPKSKTLSKSKKKMDFPDESQNIISESSEILIQDEKEEIKSRILDTNFEIKLSIIQNFGTGGNFEVDCPFCGNSIEFYYENLEIKTLKSTRICECDAISRISTRTINKNIFKDLQVSENLTHKIKKIQNEIFDEYGNNIYTFSIIPTIIDD